MEPGTHTNCVVIGCDTFRYDMIVHPVVRTPNLNRLARRAVKFTQCYGEGLPTIQARRTLFTGIRSFPWRFNPPCASLVPAIIGWHAMPSHQVPLAEHLLSNSVVTGLVADTYHMFKPTQNFTRGFASWNFIRGQEGDPLRSGPLSAIDVSKHLPSGDNDPGRVMALTQYLLNMLDRQCEEDYLPAKLFRTASRWLEDNRENDPWFLWVDSFAPHERWDPPVEFADAYFKTDKSGDYIHPSVINRTDPSHDEIERTRALYYGYVTFIDKWIGRFLDTLEQMGKLDDTLVIFTADHGTELWEKGKFSKSPARLHPYNTRVPLLVKLPGDRLAGTRRDDFCQHQDVFPTVCKQLGVPVPEAVDGRDLFDPSTPAPELIYTAWSNRLSIRTRQWNLQVDSTDPAEPRQLYNVQDDPEEDHDVLGDHPEVADELITGLEPIVGPYPYAIEHQPDPDPLRVWDYITMRKHVWPGQGDN